MLRRPQKPAETAPWPAGLREEINSLDDAKTKDLPTLSFLAVGGAVVIHKQPQFVLLGVCNNSDGVIRSIELDPREDFLVDRTPGYSVVNLQYAPLRVLVYIKTADDAGLQLQELERGVVAFAPVEKNFSIEGVGKRKFTFKRRQLPLTAGCISSVFRSQGQTMRNIILDIRRPPGPKMDSAAVYVALSRATSLGAINMLFPITLDDLNQPPDRDVLAIIGYLERLDVATLRLFLRDPSSFTPASASVDAVAEGIPIRSGRPGTPARPGTPGRHGPGATRRVAHLIANSANNCFFNSALALGLAAWDGQSLPTSSAGTPAAASYFHVVQLLRDSMFDGRALQQNAIVSFADLVFLSIPCISLYFFFCPCLAFTTLSGVCHALFPCLLSSLSVGCTAGPSRHHHRHPRNQWRRCGHGERRRSVRGYRASVPPRGLQPLAE